MQRICLFQRAGAVFPQRSEQSAPVFTPPQTQPLASYPANIRDGDARPDTAETSAESEFPTLRYVSSPCLCYLKGGLPRFY
jgi:hypothetical protein